MSIIKNHFGKLDDGTDVDLYTLTNSNGLEVSIITYGGAITSLKIPDRNGDLGDIVLGYETLEDYVRNPRYFGGLIGRHANRIGMGKFSLNDVEYQLPQNNGVNHLHGGFKGFDKRVWTAREDESAYGPRLHLSYLSPDGEENYPGNLNVSVTYYLFHVNHLGIQYVAKTDKDTIVNLTNHTYFNLAGEGTILDHELKFYAYDFTPVSKDLIPTGEIIPVAGTPMDFTRGKRIGSRIHEQHEQLSFTGGYDHNFVLAQRTRSLQAAGSLYEPTSGRMVEIQTTQPGIQFYSGNFLDGSLVGKNGVVYQKYAGLCLEPQHFPDAPNHPNFPSTVLRAEREYSQATVFKFSTK